MQALSLWLRSKRIPLPWKSDPKLLSKIKMIAITNGNALMILTRRSKSGRKPMNTIDSPMRRLDKKWSSQSDIKSQNILRRSSFWKNWRKGLTFGGQIQKLLLRRNSRTKKTRIFRRKMRVTQSNIKGIISIYAQCVAPVCRTISIKSSRLSLNSPILRCSISKNIS